MPLFIRPNAFREKIAQWKQQKLEIFWLPTYSPQLNSIEILWRFMKYEWIEIEAYSKSEKFNQVCRENFEIIWRPLCNLFCIGT